MMDTRPNILFFITDQQRYDTIQALGYPYMDTPNLDRLVNEGVVFTHNFVTGASCVPSRASLFQGTYPHTNGVKKNGDPWKHGWIENLADAGYHCVNVGKMHTNPFETPMGFHERFVVENKDRFLEGRYYFDQWDLALRTRGLIKQQRELYRKLPEYNECLGAFEWLLPEDMHPDVFVGELATWWIENKPDMQPLFMEIGFPGPHPPYDPIPEVAQRYLDKELPMPTCSEAEFQTMAPSMQNLIEHNVKIDHDSIVWNKNPSKEALHRLRSHYYANVSMIDEQIGKVLKAFEDKGLLENTIVVFTSDHGDCLGDHSQIQKWTMYDEVTRTPLIVRYPKEFSQGVQCDALCQHFDIAPVLLELAGTAPLESSEARSLTPLLRGESDSHRDVVFCEQGKDDHLADVEFMTMVRDSEWKLVHYESSVSQGELYDLVNDPKELINLWGLPAYASKVEELENKLSNFRLRELFAYRSDKQGKLA